MGSPLLAMLLGAALSGCTVPAGDTHILYGVVRDAGGGGLTLEHSEVPGVVEATTTRFAADPNLSRTVSTGDIVTARLLVPKDADALRIIGVEVTGREAAPIAPAGPAALQVGEQLPAMQIPGVDGPIALGEGQGGVIVLTFLFTTCPMPEFCPLLARKLRQLQDPIRDHGRIVSVTLDPSRDSLDVLRAYAVDQGADPAVWTFGRLELSQLKPLLQRAGVTRVETAGDILHSLHILVLDAEGRLIWRGNDNSWDVEAVAATVRAAG
ncbi:MAG: SCO family protein [Alphaproteobacteria bacterium]|nr:SCO family protein [Alphaproteobacteria bacterium]